MLVIALYSVAERESSAYVSPIVEDFYCVCGKKYKSRHTLTRHLKLECGKEPGYSCPFCSYRTKQNSNLSRHINTVHRHDILLRNFNAVPKFI